MAEIIDFETTQEDGKPKFSVRPFRAKDIAPMVRIISKIGIKQFAGVVSPQNVKAIMDKSNGAEVEDSDRGEEVDEGDQVNAVGVGVVLEVVGIFCDNFDKAEGDIFAFLASMTGMTRAEIEDLSLADTFDVLYAIFTAKDFSDFFKRARVLLAK